MTKSNIPLQPDNIYANERAKLDKFSFNQQVVDVFPDMINRSVPSYQNIVDGIGKIARQLCPNAPVIYDLGCSLGSVSLSIAKQTVDKQPTIIAVDNSEAMLQRCEQHIRAFSYGSCVTLQQGDLTEFALSPCNMVALNFTLQFISPQKRQAIIDQIYANLANCGVFILSEKICNADDDLNALLIDLHHNFKKENGYSELEISQKRSALEDVMRLDTLDVHIKRIHSAGFKKVTVWYQHFNFLSLLAIK